MSVLNNDKKPNLEKREYMEREFKVGGDCPFCDGKLYDKNYCGLYDDKIALKCENNNCYFNKVDFKLK